MNRIYYRDWNIKCKNGDLSIEVFSPFGQDVIFETDGIKTNEDFVKYLKELDESYDPDYEASLWLKDGHGVHGAPYSMQDVLDDMEWVKGELYLFSQEVEKGNIVLFGQEDE